MSEEEKLEFKIPNIKKEHIFVASIIVFFIGGIIIGDVAGEYKASKIWQTYTSNLTEIIKLEYNCTENAPQTQTSLIQLAYT